MTAPKKMVFNKNNSEWTTVIDPMSENILQTLAGNTRRLIGSLEFLEEVLTLAGNDMERLAQIDYAVREGMAQRIEDDEKERQA